MSLYLSVFSVKYYIFTSVFFFGRPSFSFHVSLSQIVFVAEQTEKSTVIEVV